MPDASKSLEVGLWLLERIESVGPDEWAKVVVAAASEKGAREIANFEAKAEGYIWTNGALTSSRKIGIAEDGVDGLILGSKE